LVQLGQYRLLEKLGQGAMGEVYKALHTRLKKWVALKILPRERVTHADDVARFEREMEAVGQLDHRHVVRATDADETEGVHFLVMEFVDGIDLGRLVRFQGGLALEAACELMRQAATGLQYIHEHGLVHRDIKPSNLLLSVQGELKILDLGLALLRGDRLDSSALTAQGQVMGTFDYMAPEQWESSHEVDIRADLYSLGCTLYTLLTARPPFGGPEYDSMLKKMRAHAEAPVPPIRDKRADVPEALAAVLERLLRKDPSARYAAPAEVARALEPFCAGADLVGLVHAAGALHTPESAAERSRRSTEGPHGSFTPPPAAGRASPARRPGRRLWGALMALAVAAAAVGIAVALWPDETDNSTAAPPAREAPARFRLRQWNNLLDRPPTEVYWRDPTGQSRWAFDDKAEILSVNTFESTLLGLGRAEVPAYKLQVGLRQARWTGGIGAFFGGRQEPGKESPAYHYQAIQLGQVGPAAERFALSRSQGRIELRPGKRPRLSSVGMTSGLLDHPLIGQEHVLEIMVTRRDGLASVRWNGKVIRELISRSVNARFHEGDYNGDFGVLCDPGSVTVSSARFMPLE
jgi:tRNA A-37 threonylcarbamoyl transferase component Bud32